MSKYNVGDVVKLRDDLEEGKRYDELKFNANMENLKNKPVKIVGIDLEGDYETESWYINDEMIEGLWEECKPKLKLIDVLNMIAKGELKEGAKVKAENEIFTLRTRAVYGTELDLYDEDNSSLLQDYWLIKRLNDEVELIEPPCEHEWLYWETHRIGEGQIRRYRRCEKCGLEEVIEKCIPDEGKTLEPSKIEELDEKVFAECDNIGKCYRLLYKLNEVVRKINKE